MKAVALAEPIHEAQSKGVIPPTIYVFVNGGPVSHYNLPDRPEAQGKDVFVQRTDSAHRQNLPHHLQPKRSRYRRFLTRRSRDSPDRAPPPRTILLGGSRWRRHATEKKISEENGYENPNLRFAKGDNTWDLAREYAKRKTPSLRILVHVGTKGFNYENNLAWMEHLKSLEIPFERLIVEDAPHSAKIIYEKQGEEIMKFHAESFRLAGATEDK